MGDPPRIIPPGQVLPPMNPRPPAGARDAAGTPDATGPKGTVNGKPKGGKADKAGTANRFGVLNGFVDCGMADLTRSEIAAWLVLYRDTRGGVARTGKTDIARRIGSSPRAVTDAIGGLRRRGLVELVRRGSLRIGPSTYRVHPLPKPPK